MDFLRRAYGDQGRLEDAVKLLKEVLEARYQVSGSDDASTLNTTSHLAWTLAEQGDSAKEKSSFQAQQGNILQAKSIANEALEILRQAETLYTIVFDSRSKALGNDHPDTLQTAANLAWVYWKQGRTGDAIELFETVLRKREQILGQGHPDKLWIINSLAKLYQEDGRLTAAEEKYKKLLEILKGFKERDPRIYVTEHDLAWIYGLQRRTDEAIETLEELLKKGTEDTRDEHPQTLRTMYNLAYLYYEKGDAAKALSVYRDVYTRRQRVLGEGHPDTVRSLLWMCHIERGLGTRGTLFMSTEVSTID